MINFTKPKSGTLPPLLMLWRARATRPPQRRRASFILCLKNHAAAAMRGSTMKSGTSVMTYIRELRKGVSL